MEDDWVRFANFISQLIVKYAEVLDLDNLPDQNQLMPRNKI